MNCLADLRVYVRQVATEHPDLKPQLREIYELAADEIADEEPEQHEVEMAVSDIKELIAKKAEAK